MHNQLRRKSLLLFVFAFAALFASAQNKSNKGKEFWLGYGHNVLFTQDPPINSQTHVLYLSTEAQPATVTVSVNGTTWSQTVNIPANTVNASVLVPKSGADDARLTAEGKFTRGIHIVSDVPIVAYSHQYGLFSSAATMLMPVETFGYTYYSLNYTQVSNYVDSYSWFYVVASEDNTRVLITPSDSTQGGWLPTQTYTVNLNKGEIYNVFGKGDSRFSSKDMTGSKIVSVAGGDGQCHPVGVFSGSSRNIICNYNGGEILQQQIFPASAWGTKYITYHTVNNTAGNVATPFLNHYRVAVRKPTTVVKRNGVVLTGLTNNFYYQFSSTGGDVIEADEPVLVAQYTVSSNECVNPGSNPIGDPEMIYLSPIEQGVKRAAFYSNRNQAISVNFINAIVPTAGLSSVLIDGVALASTEYIPHPTDPAYTVVCRRLTGPAAQHSISCDSSFIATAYGIGITESYGYNVGTFVNNLNARSSFKNVYSTNSLDSFTCPKSPFRLYVDLAYQATQINWKLSGVAGLQPAADSLINNPVPVGIVTVNGRKYYRYTLRQDYTFPAPGTYTVPFTYTAPDIDACNQTESGSITIEVRPGPSGDFTISAARCLSDSVTFSGIANTGGFTLSQYLWTFSDATTATTLNVTKKFATAGAQPVRFQVIATNGCTGDTTKTVTIDAAPVTKFGVSGNACTRDSILISDSTAIAGGTVNAWRWDMGDGTVLNKTSAAPFRYAYASPGTYRIKLTATSSNGCKSDTAFKDITAFEKPTASFTHDRNICVGDSIRFRDSSRITNGSIAVWQWTFGDGNNATYTNGNPFYHPYTSAGSFAVKLKVQSPNGCADSTTKTVTVSAKPTATVSAANFTCVDSLWGLTSSSPTVLPVGTTWWWSFGDGQTATSGTSNGITHTYSATATNLLIKHVVNIGQGCASDTVSFVLSAVHPNPTASFTIVADTLCPKSYIGFAADTTGIASWSWNFGNGTGNSLPPFTRQYNSAGTYTVSLTVKNAFGCGSAPFIQPLVIYPLPAINAGPDKYVKSGEQTTLDAAIANPSNYTFTWAPAATLSNPNVLNPIASPQATTEYTIEAMDNTSNCSATDKVVVNIYNGLYIPTGFTPNGDGRNDAWVIPGLAQFPDALVTVFNRWGQVVYQTKNYIGNPWDGKIKGEAVGSSTTFVYLVQLNDKEKQVFKGTLTIIR